MDARSATALAAAVKRCLSEDESLDVGGILWLEHLNFVVGDRDIALRFYCGLLGMSQDPGPSFHLNLGQQQFHLNVGEPHVIAGSIGLAVPSLDTIRQRLAASLDFGGTSFAYRDDGASITVTCPWGNTVHLFSVDAADVTRRDDNALPRLARLQAGLDSTMSVRGLPGIRFLELLCPVGTAGRIASFYKELFGAHVSKAEGYSAVCVGPSVHLVFMEEDVSDVQLGAMNGVHACLYISHFKRTYDELSARQLIWTNPAFIHLDTCESFTEASASRQYRFKDIIDLCTGEKLLELEHETRAVRHFQFFKRVAYSP